MRRRWPKIREGDLYEDCGYSPALCYRADPVAASRGWRKWLRRTVDVDLSGISLLDGSRLSCSAKHCAPRKLTLTEVMSMRSVYEKARRDSPPAQDGKGKDEHERT
jgi:hypothetical protein